MFRHDLGDETVVRYLLGRLPDAERDKFEDRYFSDDELHEQLQAIEEELIDAYVRGRLGREDTAAFESRFLLSPERRQKIEFARTLAALPPTDPPPREIPAVLFGWIRRSPAMRWSFVGAAAVIAAVLLVLRFWPTAPPPSVVAKLPSPQQPVHEKREGESEAATKNPHPSPKLPPVLAFALMPGVRGEGSPNRISIPSGTYRIRLNLAVSADAGFPRYAASIATADGKEVWRDGNLRRNGQTVAIIVSSAVLPAGEYAVRLTGIAGPGTSEDVAGYAFSVAPK